MILMTRIITMVWSTHLEPDILEFEVKWARESITTNKASGCDRILAELFQILKMMLWKCCTKYASKIVKLNSAHRTGKGKFSLQPQRKWKKVKLVSSVWLFATP